MKRSRPRWRSVKRAQTAPERAALVAEVMARDRYQCQAALRGAPGRCGGPLDAHEIIPRSAWAQGYLVRENVIAVCRLHHAWIGDFPGQDDVPHFLGLHGFSWERP